MSTDEPQDPPPETPTTRKTVQTARDEIGVEIDALDARIKIRKGERLAIDTELTGLELAKSKFVGVLDKLK